MHVILHFISSSFISNWNPFTHLKWSEVAQSCPTLCDPMYCSPPGSSLHGILQARVLERVAISFSRGSSRPRDWTRVSCIPGRHFNLWATREAPKERCNALDSWFFYSFCLGNQVPPSSLIPLAHVPTTGQTAHSPVAVWRTDTTAASTLGNPELTTHFLAVFSLSQGLITYRIIWTTLNGITCHSGNTCYSQGYNKKHGDDSIPKNVLLLCNMLLVSSAYHPPHRIV